MTSHSEGVRLDVDVKQNTCREEPKNYPISASHLILFFGLLGV